MEKQQVESWRWLTANVLTIVVILASFGLYFVGRLDHAESEIREEMGQKIDRLTQSVERVARALEREIGYRRGREGQPKEENE